MQTLGWAGLIRIDGQSYRWLGGNDIPDSTSCNLTARQTTPTRTILQYEAGPMNLTVTYLSPIEVRQINLQRKYVIQMPYSSLTIG